MARISRPPGFEMTYRPEREAFLPPLKERLPATVYFGITALFGAAVVLAPQLSSGNWLYQFVVVGDRNRVMSAQVFALLLFVSGLAAIMRRYMSGVIVHPDGIETREVLPLGMPRIRKLAWAQIDRVSIPPAPKSIAAAAPDETRMGGTIKKIRLDLWDGSHQFLPDVAKGIDLSLMIERVALARAIPIEGGTGLLDDLDSPFGEDGN